MGWKVADMKPAPPPGFTTTQGRLGPNHPQSERRHGQRGIPARRLQRHAPDSARPFPTTGTNTPHPSRRPCPKRDVAPQARPSGHPCTVLRDTQATNRQRRGRHAFAQPAAASSGVPTGRCSCGGALALPDPALPGRGLQGCQACAAGIACRAFPWRQAQRAAPRARRRERIKPHGRDSARSTGRSPKSPAALRADTPRPFYIFSRERRTP